ncbi:MAG: SufD family Fe-S cluster assembly protein [Proteobacteria bacterium]|nr:SufD family Fe-S cluster assembly protein [Pseudomonadota bacterium]
MPNLTFQHNFSKAWQDLNKDHAKSSTSPKTSSTNSSTNNHALIQHRKQAMLKLKDTHWPSKKDEAWVFTYPATRFLQQHTYSVAHSLNKISLDNTTSLDRKPESLWDKAWTFYFYNGKLQPTDNTEHYNHSEYMSDSISCETMAQALERQPDLYKDFFKHVSAYLSPSPFYTLCHSLLNHAYVITIHRDLPQPLQLYFDYHYTSESEIASPYILIISKATSSLRLHEHHNSVKSPYAGFSNMVMDISLQPHSSIIHSSTVELSPSCRFIRSSHVLQESSSCYKHLSFHSDSQLSRHDLAVLLKGEASETHLDGVYINAHHLDHHIHALHVGKKTVSKQNYKGITYGFGHSIFDGKMHIKQSGEEADAHLLNHNLLLDHTARVDTKPELISHYDDVKAVHGATISNLRADNLWYLKSRGIKEKTAKRLLTSGFFYAILKRWPKVCDLSYSKKKLTFIEERASTQQL